MTAKGQLLVLFLAYQFVLPFVWRNMSNLNFPWWGVFAVWAGLVVVLFFFSRGRQDEP